LPKIVHLSLMGCFVLYFLQFTYRKQNNIQGTIVKKNNLYKSGFHLLNLFGFEVRIDWTWFFLAILISWTLAVGYFPVQFPKLSTTTYWIMGIIGALGLFASIVLHELCHSLVGRIYGIPISRITLFIFGGMAEMRDEPPSPKAEFLMAIAGPLLSISLGIIFYLLYHFGTYAKWPVPFNGVVSYLSVINFVVGIFNLLPGFPLDGGRVLRAIIWWWTGNLKKATQMTSHGGTLLGFILITLGILQIIQGWVIAGIWMFLIGFFLQAVSKMSYQQLFIKEIFRGEAIGKYTKTNPVSVESDTTVQELVDQIFYKYYHKLYPVLEKGKLVGSISFNEIRNIEKEKWPSLQVGQVMNTSLSDFVVDVNTDVMKVLRIMQSQKNSRLLVTDHDDLYGIITLKDIMNIISLKLSLEGKDKT
jgi:Zn-dependent protease/CBS domain-containing protein